MALRTAHGSGASALVRVEVQPLDEQLPGIPCAQPAPTAAAPKVPSRRRPPPVQHLTAEQAREKGRAGGLKAAANRAKLKAVEGLGLLGADPGVMRTYLEAASEWASAELRRLAQQVGGGLVEPNVAALVQGAALALAGSRYAYAQAALTGDPSMLKLGKELQQASRQEALAAREVCSKDAHQRPAESARERLERQARALRGEQ